MPTSVLVVGATGTQGGAVADRLLASEHDFDVHALTRSPDGDAARALADRGVTVREGNLLDRDTLDDHFAAVDAAFGMTDFWSAGGYDAELEQGRNLASAAETAGLDHLVFSSIEHCDERPGVPLVDVKADIEARLAESDVPTTTLWTHNFMTNFEGQRESILGGELAMPLAEDTRLRLLHVGDIGAATELAIRDPAEYAGQTLELVGEEATLTAMAATFSSVTGVDVAPIHLPVEAAREEMGDVYAGMFEWFNEREYAEDLAALQSRVPIEFTTLEEYLRTNGWGS